MIKHAVILCAGIGERMKDYLQLMNTHKSLLFINNTPMLLRTLHNLEKNGIETAAIAVGHRGVLIKSVIGDYLGNMRISYIENSCYNKTNTMYSTWLAEECLQKGCLLIEGDTLHEERIINKLLNTDDDKSYWVGERFNETHDGCRLTANTWDMIVKQKIVPIPLDVYRNNHYKSCGLLKITPNYGRKLYKWLCEDISTKSNDYYDLIIGRHLDEELIYILDITGLKWVEIDTVKDLERARGVFS